MDHHVAGSEVDREEAAILETVVSMAAAEEELDTKAAASAAATVAEIALAVHHHQTLQPAQAVADPALVAHQEVAVHHTAKAAQTATARPRGLQQVGTILAAVAVRHMTTVRRDPVGMAAIGTAAVDATLTVVGAEAIWSR
jgi:hypothetical protein